MTKSLTLTLLSLAILPLGKMDAVSLWMKSTNNQKGLFVGKRAYAVGDLITIDVSESSSLAASQNSVRNRQSQVENAVKQFLFANSGMGKHNGGLPARKSKLKVATRAAVRLQILRI